MYTNLQIDGDPTMWSLAQAIDVSKLPPFGQTLAVQVTSPLNGTMLLSRKSAASMALFTRMSPEGSVPHDIRLMMPILYLPSSAGPQVGSPGYELPVATDLGELARNIEAAMATGQPYTVEIAGSLSGGQLLLNGAVLPFVVLCPAAPAGGFGNMPPPGSVPHD
jgi:hypothetical protein